MQRRRSRHLRRCRRRRRPRCRRRCRHPGGSLAAWFRSLRTHSHNRFSYFISTPSSADDDGNDNNNGGSGQHHAHNRSLIPA